MRFLQKILLRVALWRRPPYHPVLMDARYVGSGDRNCFDRWEMIRTEIKKHDARTLLDIGCAEGFYVLKGAQEGCLALGFDADPARLAVAQSQLALEKIVGAGFVLSLVDEPMLDRLPTADMVLFLSVMHHLMYVHGVPYCKNYLEQVRKKVKKVLIFEMGQSNETQNAWAGRLPDMGSEPHSWIRTFLLSAGFSRVEKIGESDSYKKDTRRAVFAAYP